MRLIVSKILGAKKMKGLLSPHRQSASVDLPKSLIKKQVHGEQCLQGRGVLELDSH